MGISKNNEVNGCKQPLTGDDGLLRRTKKPGRIQYRLDENAADNSLSRATADPSCEQVACFRSSCIAKCEAIAHRRRGYRVTPYFIPDGAVTGRITACIVALYLAPFRKGEEPGRLMHRAVHDRQFIQGSSAVTVISFSRDVWIVVN